jgi:hypothetical protein
MLDASEIPLRPPMQKIATVAAAGFEHFLFLLETLGAPSIPRFLSGMGGIPTNSRSTQFPKML